MHRIFLAYFTETVHNRNYMRIRRVHNSVWMQRLLCLILVFTLSGANIAPWASQDTDMDCEVAMQLFQVPCLVLSNGYSRTDVSHSDTVISECVKSCHSVMQDSFPVPVSEFMPVSGPDTCQCSRGARGQTRPFKVRLPDSPQRPLRLAAITPLQIPYSDGAFSWDHPEQTLSFLPSDHLKSLSTIVLTI